MFFFKSKESNVPTAEETPIYVLIRRATSDLTSFNVFLLTSSGHIMSLHYMSSMQFFMHLSQRLDIVIFPFVIFLSIHNNYFI